MLVDERSFHYCYRSVRCGGRNLVGKSVAIYIMYRIVYAMLYIQVNKFSPMYSGIKMQIAPCMPALKV
jgi:hypothetical protein